MIKHCRSCEHSKGEKDYKPLCKGCGEWRVYWELKVVKEVTEVKEEGKDDLHNT